MKEKKIHQETMTEQTEEKKEEVQTGMTDREAADTAANAAAHAASAGQTATEASGTAEPSLQEKLDALEKEHAELKDQYLRKVADFDNYRKRMIREKQEVYDYANTGLLTDLVTVLDDFDRAITAAQDAKDVASVVEGVRMINRQMSGMLETKYNLTAYAQKGDPFDHDIHEAIGSTPAPVADPVCAEVYLKGYKLRDRVIRLAKVLVHMPDGSVSGTGAATDSPEPAGN